MKKLTIGCSTGAMLFGALLTIGVAAKDFKWQGRVAQGESVTVRGVNGKIVARSTDDREVSVEATKKARGDDPDSVSIEVVEDAEGVLICAVYPSRRNREANRCARGREYKMNVRNNDVEVNFVVEVPSGVDLDAATVNGSIKARDLPANVKAATVNGEVDVSGAGVVSAVTVNGSIDARMGTAPREPLEFNTVNGGINVGLPQNTHANLDIKTVNGHIESDFPITIKGRWGPRKARGQIGDGGPEIELHTVNGSVEISSN